MDSVFVIDDLVKHILSFIPRKVIIPCLLVNKIFNRCIPIDYDYESVAKNGDLYSLMKIKYSPGATINIAYKYKNVEMMKWIWNNKKDHLHKYFDVNKYRLSILVGYMNINIYDFNFNWRGMGYGLIEGKHYDMIDRFSKCFKSNDNVYRLFPKIHDDAIKQKLITLIEDNTNVVEWATKMYGIIDDDPNVIKVNINNIIDDIDIDTDIYPICDFLIDLGHFDIFVWLASKYDYDFNDYDIFDRIIMHGELEYFEYAIKNLKYTLYHFQINLIVILIMCAPYKRIDMILFLINYHSFSNYDDVIKTVKELGFSDIEKVFTDNEHLLKT